MPIDRALAAISDVAGGLVPDESATPHKQYNWRLRMWAMTCANFFAWIAGAVIAFGWIPPVSAGFARSEDLQALAISTMSTQLLQLRKDQCKAETSEQKVLYYRLLQETLEQYRKLTGRDWPMPPCEAL